MFKNKKIKSDIEVVEEDAVKDLTVTKESKIKIIRNLKKTHKIIIASLIVVLIAVCARYAYMKVTFDYTDEQLKELGLTASEVRDAEKALDKLNKEDSNTEVSEKDALGEIEELLKEDNTDAYWVDYDEVKAADEQEIKDLYVQYRCSYGQSENDSISNMLAVLSSEYYSNIQDSQVGISNVEDMTDDKLKENLERDGLEDKYAITYYSEYNNMSIDVQEEMINKTEEQLKTESSLSSACKKVINYINSEYSFD